MRLFDYRAANPPDPWFLNNGTGWFERLDVKQNHWAQYCSLSMPEIMLLEGLRATLEEYGRNEMLQDDKTAKGLGNRFGRSVAERLWLNPGTLKSLAFRGGIEVLRAYALYRDWMATIPKQDAGCFPLIVPYYLEWISGKMACGNGAIFIMLKRSGPKTGKIGELHWERAILSISEIERKKGVHPENKREDPFEHIQSATGGDVKKTGGLLAFHAEFVQRLFDNPDVAFSHHRKPYFSQMYWEIDLRDPTQQHVQELFDAFCKRFFIARLNPASFLQFDVDPDLSVTSGTVFLKKTIFEGYGAFFRGREKPLSEYTLTI